jgi:hypothetical protein
MHVIHALHCKCGAVSSAAAVAAKQVSRIHLQQLFAAPVVATCDDGGSVGQTRRRPRELFRRQMAKAVDASHESSGAVEFDAVESSVIMRRSIRQQAQSATRV